VKTGTVSKFASRILTFGAVGAVVAGFMASPVAAAAAPAAPMTHISTNYAAVSRAPRLPSGARDLGATSATKTISGAVALAPRNPAALQRAAEAVSNPRSKSYRHFLAKGAVAADFGPSAATINAVESTLRASNLKVTSVSGNGLLVNFRGTVASADAAFRTTIANVRLANGRTGTETTRPVSFPASIARQVTSVVGLDTLVRAASSLEHGTHPAAVKPTIKHPAAPSANGPSACAAATGGASEFGGLTDDQIAHDYGVDGLYNAGDNGTGQTIAVFELEPFSTADLSAFDTCYYGATKAAQMAGRLSITNVDGGAGTGEGSGESILDVDDVSGIAPGANIDVYEAPNTNTGSIDMYNQIVQTDTAQEISTSWAFCEQDEINLEPGYINVENDVFEQAALQGQTLFASSGDAGSDACAYHAAVPFAPTLSESDPANQPFVTAVGGTTTTDADNRPTEQVWNDGSIGGGAGGGMSSVWGAPSWQQGFLDTASAQAAVTAGQTPCAESSNGALCREIPDVSAQADEYTGAITVFAAEFGGWTTFGGTSSSTPLWAAMMADVNASAGCSAGQPGFAGSVGFASPALYAVASVPSEYAASFNDVTAGNNDVYDLFNGALYAAHTGYDMASGLGTPELTSPSGGAGLAAYLCGLSTAPTPAPSVTSVSPATVSATPSGSLTINGTNLTGVTKLSIGGFNVPSANWSVNGGGTAITVTTIPTATQVGTGSQGPQEGTGRATVSVTNPTTGESSAITAAGTVLYVKSTTSSVPSVDGVAPFGGPTAGGNTVTVFGSGFASSGADQITHVTFGGVDATSFTVLSATKLSVVVPPMTGGTVCAAGDDKTNDVCQAQLVVTNANGSSTTSTILPPYTGAPFEGISGGLPLPTCVTGSSCEIVPATSEYDYLVAPSITSITTTSSGDPIAYASENGDTIATIKGSGFDYLGFDWVNVGNPTVAANADFGTISVTPTELQVVIPGREFSHKAIVAQLSIQTLQGLSAPSPISYAPIPQVTGDSPQFGPDTGGTSIDVTGTGFTATDVADGGMLAYQYVEFGVPTNQLSGYTVTNDTSLTATTPQNNPGEFTVQACTLTGCSFPTTQANFDNTLFDFYQPGAPVVTGVSKKTGPASGGTEVVIHGRNLADAIEVVFGKTVAEAANAPEILTNGSSTEVDAIAPPGKAGAKVNIQVVTVESFATNRSASAPTAAATFTYKASVASAPQDVTASQAATTLTVKWKAPLSTGGHAITHYRVSAISLPNSDRKGAKKPPTVVVTTKSGAQRMAKLTKLRGGWTYEVEVQAVNSLGRGLPGQPQRVYFITDPA
jgi:hypothetical protein